MIKNARALLRDSWFSADPRSLALFRIGLALLLLGDLVRRIPGLETWYSNAGLTPNHTQLWRPAARWLFSGFFLASHPEEAAVGFAICALIFVGLLVGWKTKLMQVLAFAASVSLHSRSIILENGGDVVLNLICAWSMFLPLGRRFSVDALLASMRSRKECNAAELAQRDSLPADTRPVISLAVFALLLQFAVIYFFNAIHKTGAIWMDGTVVHYALHQDRIVTTIGALVRDGFPVWLSKVLTWFTLVLEGAAPLLILTPFWRVGARRLAIALLPGMHLGFALFMNVGFFSPTMCVFYLLLPAAADWELVKRFFAGTKRSKTVVFDGSCGVCFQVARVLARIDVFRRLAFVDNSGSLPKGVTRAMVERTIVTIDDATGARSTETRAFAEIFAALPLGLPISWILRAAAAPGDRVYRKIADNRQAISLQLGLAACGIPSTSPLALPEPPEAPIRGEIRRRLGHVREAAVALLLVATTLQGLNENRAVPRWLKIPQPEFLQAIVVYPRLFQGWSMFAPNPPTKDGMVVVDAVTVDGRRIDPYNFAASGWEGEPWTEIPGRLDQDQFWCDYTNRIKGNGGLHHVLQDWILRHHKRTGNPKDRIVSFDAYWLEDTSPLPGSTETTDRRREKFLSYGKPAPTPRLPPRIASD